MKPHYSERNHAYYMTFETDTDKWFNIKDEALKLPITKEYADSMTLAVNTGDKWVQNGTSCINDKGFPHISFYQGDKDGSTYGSPKQMAHYQWTGKEWIGGSTNLPVEARGELLPVSSENVQVLLGNNVGEFGEVAWWNSTDGGETFTKEKVYIKEEGAKFKLANFIRNAHPEARIIATQKIKGTDYSRVYLLGDKGPVKRSKVDADVLSFD